MPILNNLNKIARAVGDGARTAAKKSEEIVELAKVKMAIAAEEDKIHDAYEAMGQIVFDKYQGSEISETELTDLCKRVEELKAKIESLKQKAPESRSIGFCNDCGAVVDDKASFCSKCGTRCDAKFDTKQ